MKFVQFAPNDDLDNLRLGHLTPDGTGVVDLCCQKKCGTTTTMLKALQAGNVEKLVNVCSPEIFPLTKITLVAPITGMDKILCVGHNYKDHCAEIDKPPPEIPTFFSKFSSSIIGPDLPVRIRTDVCQKVDWEVELAVVIGKSASSVKAEDANQYIFGYTIAQDIGDREWQREKNGPHFLLGKSQDTFCPIGPCIVTADEIGDVNNLDLSCSVNGVQKQKSNTSNFVHNVPAIIERVTTVMTLLPGDLILTGTPGGVGDNLKPPEYLKPGDLIVSEIQNIGVLETKIEQF